MNAWRRALRNLEQHLEEVVGMDDAAAIVNGFDQHVTNDHLDRAFDLHAERLRTEFRTELGELRNEVRAELDQLRSEVAHLPDQLAARWRRDLLVHSSVQLTALIAVVAALIALM